MGKKYKGKFFAQANPAALVSRDIYFEIRVSKEQINFFNKLIEAYDHMAFVVQVNPSLGILGLYTTKDQVQDLRDIINNLPFQVEFL